MHFNRIPVRVIAENIHEYQCIADVLAGGAAEPLVLAAPHEKALLALLCPSGDVAAASGLPYIALGRSGFSLPASLSDILVALEVLARESAQPARLRDYKGWVLDPARLILSAPDARVIELTETEARLLAILFDAGGEELDKADLLEQVWGYRPGLETHTLETHIYRLRQKIEPDPTRPSFLMTSDAGYYLA